MADLSPLVMPDGRPYRYAARDWIGVEKPGAVSARGINAACAWTRRFEAALMAEHRSDGVHNTLKIPKARLLVRRTGGGSGRMLEPDSFVMEKYGDWVASPSHVGGVTTITMNGSAPLAPGGTPGVVALLLPDTAHPRRLYLPVISASNYTVQVGTSYEFILLAFW